MSRVSASHNFRRHIFYGSTEGIGSFILIRQKLLTETKVCENHVAAGVQEEIFEFDVPINYSQLVQMLEGQDNLPDIDLYFVLGESFPLG